MRWNAAKNYQPCFACELTYSDYWLRQNQYGRLPYCLNAQFACTIGHGTVGIYAKKSIFILTPLTMIVFGLIWKVSSSWPQMSNFYADRTNNKAEKQRKANKNASTLSQTLFSFRHSTKMWVKWHVPRVTSMYIDVTHVRISLYNRKYNVACHFYMSYLDTTRERHDPRTSTYQMRSDFINVNSLIVLILRSKTHRYLENPKFPLMI